MKLSHPIYVPSCLRHSAPNLDPEAKMSCAVITDSLSRKCVFVCVSKLMRVQESIGCRLNSTLSISIF